MTSLGMSSWGSRPSSLINISFLNSALSGIKAQLEGFCLGCEPNDDVCGDWDVVRPGQVLCRQIFAVYNSISEQGRCEDIVRSGVVT